jgi:hypothetical protein
MTTRVGMFVQALDGGAALAMAMLVAIAARSAARAGARTADLTPVVILLSVGFGASTAISVADGFSTGTYGLLLLALSFIVPLAIGVTLVSTSSDFRRLISRPEIQPGVVAVHGLRIVQGSVFVVMVPLGVLPAIFALPAGLGDLLVGLGALAAVRWVSSGRWGRVIWWNLFGLFDLATAVVLGLLTVPGLHLLQTTPTSALLLASPLAIIPTFCVPIYVLLHLVSLRFLVASRSAAQPFRAVRLETSA